MARVLNDALSSRTARSLAWGYAAGAVGLGITGLAFRDFALQWQPVPPSLLLRESFALAAGLALIVGGLALLTPGLSGMAALAALIFDGAWVLTLLVPRVFAAPGSIVAWLGVAEISSLAAAAAMLLAVARGSPALASTSRVAFGCCALIFGLSHFAYAGFTASMVPNWLPWRVGWAYATGVGHLAAGAAILADVWRRQAATALAFMCGAFVLLLHVPRVANAPSSHAEWTMMFVALSIAGAAWVMRADADEVRAA